jgi:hypothetical protein
VINHGAITAEIFSEFSQTPQQDGTRILSALIRHNECAADKKWECVRRDESRLCVEGVRKNMGQQYTFGALLVHDGVWFEGGRINKRWRWNEMGNNATEADSSQRGNENPWVFENEMILSFHRCREARVLERINYTKTALIYYIFLHLTSLKFLLEHKLGSMFNF